MTLTKTTVDKKTYTGDAATVVFAYDFKILADADIKVVLQVIATGVETTLTLTTDYTVSGAGDASGGNVTTVATYASTHKVIITRDIDFTQPTDLTSNDDVPSEDYETMVDRMAMICKQLEENYSSLMFISSAETTTLPVVPVLSTGYLYWDGTAFSWDTPTITSTDYLGDISFGLDASKSATPGAGDYYLATDTKVFYECFVANTWVANSHLYLKSGEEFRVYNSSGTERLQFNEAGDLQIDGDLDVTGTITQTGNIQFVIDNSGTAITTGIKGQIQIPWACTITAATALPDQSGSIVVDIWNDTYANYPPTNADTITAAAPVTITATTKSTDTTLTGWTTAVAANDILMFNVDSCTTITRVTIILEYSRT